MFHYSYLTKGTGFTQKKSIQNSPFLKITGPLTYSQGGLMTPNQVGAKSSTFANT